VCACRATASTAFLTMGVLRRRAQALLALPNEDEARRLVLLQPALLAARPESLQAKLAALANSLLRLRLLEAVEALGAAPDGPAPAAASAACTGDCQADPPLRSAASVVHKPSGAARARSLAHARALAVAAPTLLTLAAAPLAQRLCLLAAALGRSVTAEEALPLALADARLLLLPQRQLADRISELAFALRAPRGPVVAWLLGERVSLLERGVGELREGWEAWRGSEAGQRAWREWEAWLPRDG
jgi:hypothetical protein